MAGAAGAERVIVTDLESFVPLMKRNIDQNPKPLSGCTVEAVALDWREISNGNVDCEKHVCRGADYLLVSDCIYYKGFFYLIFF